MVDFKKKLAESKFRVELEGVINRHNKESGSDTPDLILADYLLGCLKAFDKAVNQREEWYNRKDKDLLNLL